MKKNIFKSILITNFIVMTLVVLLVFVTQSIVLNHIDYSDEEKNTYIESGKQFENSLQNLSGDDRYFQEGLIFTKLSSTSILLNARSLLSAIIFSIIIGTGIGYLITIVDGSQKTGSIVKKVLVAYFVGLLISVVIIALLEKIEYNMIDPSEMLAIAFLWTVVFIVTLLSKKAIDNKKANNLKNLFELIKKQDK